MEMDKEFFIYVTKQLNEVLDKLLLANRQSSYEVHLGNPNLTRLTPVEDLRNVRVVIQCKSCGSWSTQLPSTHQGFCKEKANDSSE